MRREKAASKAAEGDITPLPTKQIVVLMLTRLAEPSKHYPLEHISAQC